MATETLGAAAYRSIAELWQQRVRSTPDAEAMTYRGSQGWSTLSWRQAGQRVERIAAGLLSCGLEPRQRCCVLSRTRVEWVLSDMAILCAGGATTTLYPTSAPTDAEFVLGDSGSCVVFAEDDSQVAKLHQLRDRLPEIFLVVVFQGRATSDGWVITLEQLEERGADYLKAHPDCVTSSITALGPEDLATLIYTSGTTGQPKGVMLSHDAWIYEAEALNSLRLMTPADRQLLCLPLAHVFAKLLQISFIRLGLPTVVEGDLDQLPSTLRLTKPTWMGGVPRIFEKFHERILAEVAASRPAKQRLFHWAVELGRQVAEAQNDSLPAKVRLQHAVAERLVLSPLRSRFGGRLRFFISGGAPLPVETARFFEACGLPVLEGYGLTESSAASLLNRPYNARIGTVGTPLPGCEVRIADDGEILLRSRGVMMGYHNLPDATDEALTADGWLHTGDLGILLETGHVEITGRKKDLIITAGGKNIAPANFESRLKARCRYVKEVLMHGDRRPYCTALITIDVDALPSPQGTRLSARGQAAVNPEVRSVIQRDVDRVNRELASFETVKRFAILDTDFTVDNGFLTPTLKVRRAAVEATFEEILNSLY